MESKLTRLDELNPKLRELIIRFINRLGCMPPIQHKYVALMKLLIQNVDDITRLAMYDEHNSDTDDSDDDD
jgi:hypothetical protein